ncbi:unnamed protein product [Clonostachys chloroleuca]|uniref:Alpha-type protein kinase domain-containing protein n=1 Tax=Clonostachys chloroleuca TaxID=1926264 RepID=A0AA35PZK6_9HYPO|nr:unnamed protein product [Clonostachys chloroleuca]
MTPTSSPKVINYSRVEKRLEMPQYANDNLRSPRSSTPNKHQKRDGLSRCVARDNGHQSEIPSDAHSNSGQCNTSTNAEINAADIIEPYAEGSFRYVAPGTYTSGPRKGEPCVLKWFKTGVVFEPDYFTLDIRAVGKALEIVDHFNNLNVTHKTIRINVPEVWFVEPSNHPRLSGWKGARMLCEPFIDNYEKFNSNSGWYDASETWGEVMQALSHFSYHVSDGSFVLCDLQGGVYRREIVLSDPVILSRKREYGVTDLGPEGISSFFYQHNCNSFCSPQWKRPLDPLLFFSPRMGTSMMKHSEPMVCTRRKRGRVIT